MIFFLEIKKNVSAKICVPNIFDLLLSQIFKLQNFEKQIVCRAMQGI